MTQVVSVVVQEAEPGLAVAVYPVMGEPPVAGEGSQVSVTRSSASATAVGVTGGNGALAAIGTY
jgi:hypothetical protein